MCDFQESIETTQLLQPSDLQNVNNKSKQQNSNRNFLGNFLSEFDSTIDNRKHS